MKREISNSDDVIDSRDVIARIETLEACYNELLSANDEQALKEWEDGDEGVEFNALKELASDAEGYAPDWEHGAQLIRDSYFVQAMQELLDDIGDLPKGLPSYIAIDWDATARNLQVDYTSVEFDGVTYWVR